MDATPLRLELDPDRGRRTGVPEIVYAPGKSAAQVAAAFSALLAAGVEPVLAARCTPDQVTAVLAVVPEAHVTGGLVAARSIAEGARRVAVVTAGTADQHVADEAAATLAAFGFGVDRIDDIGVAGVHRLLARADDLRAADALVVIAGMEGALPTAVAGLVDTPLVAVPTSTGYGSSFEGITALAAMTASCAPGVSVVGIDNGLGAACTIVRWLRPRGERPGA
ncbi:MAG TPA: nickel pincer cofactor biosynthesis protein LarB [Ilumatobacter sp.]|nr:nickel pincer cofactor biosynthesis protein LarB [Ilumatobacter sp.]